MDILVTLDVLKQRIGEKEIHFPKDTLITKEAKAFATKNNMEIYIGDEKISPTSTKDKSDIYKAVISVIGEDKVGIIAGISDVLSEANVNILDITQTAIEGLFTMIMVVDTAKSNISFNELKERLSQRGKELTVRVDAQREQVFHFMHRI